MPVRGASNFLIRSRIKRGKLMTKMHKIVAILFLFAAATVGGIAAAQPGEGGGRGPGGGGRGDGRRGPPPAAFDACKGKKVDAACEVTFGDRKMNGKCAETEDKKLVCRPDRAMGGPPPELLKACEKKKEGDACSAAFGDRKVEGKCQTGRAGALMCRPVRRPP